MRVLRIRRRPLVVSVIALTSVAAAFFVVSPSAYAQTSSEQASANSIRFDVISIRQNKTGSRSSAHAGTDVRYSSTNVSLKSILAKIFNIKEDLIFGIPGPADAARFDIEAKIADPDPEALKKMTREQQRRMLLPMLTDRLQLKTHVETKTLPVFDLVVAKSGTKLVRSADQSKHGGMSGRGDTIKLNYSFEGMPLSSLTDLLTDRVHRTVIDKTGLEGYYDFALTWAKHDPPEDATPTLFTAVQEQLGLKLEAGKGLVETLVVDHVEMPSEN